MNLSFHVATTAIITKNSPLPILKATIVSIKIFDQNNATYQSRLVLKHGSKQIKNSNNKLS